jgi:hypothetical protein
MLFWESSNSMVARNTVCGVGLNIAFFPSHGVTEVGTWLPSKPILQLKDPVLNITSQCWCFLFSWHSCYNNLNPLKAEEERRLSTENSHNPPHRKYKMPAWLSFLPHSPGTLWVEDFVPFIELGLCLDLNPTSSAYPVILDKLLSLDFFFFMCKMQIRVLPGGIILGAKWLNTWKVFPNSAWYTMGTQQTKTVIIIRSTLVISSLFKMINPIVRQK